MIIDDEDDDEFAITNHCPPQFTPMPYKRMGCPKQFQHGVRFEVSQVASNSFFDMLVLFNDFTKQRLNQSMYQDALLSH